MPSTVLDVAFGRSLPLKATSRWVDIATVRMRFLAVAVPKRLLPRALEGRTYESVADSGNCRAALSAHSVTSQTIGLPARS